MALVVQACEKLSGYEVKWSKYLDSSHKMEDGYRGQK
jgi:hypothetical protein